MRFRPVLLALACALSAACSPNFRVIRSGPVVAPPIAPAPRIFVQASSVTVHAGTNHIQGDPQLVAQLGAEVERVLGASGAVTIAPSEGESDLVLDVAITLTGNPDGGAIAWAALNGCMITVPSLLGAPFGWFSITTDATFLLRDRSGAQVGRSVAQDNHGYLYGYYYGHHVFDAPYEDGLAAVLTSLVEYLRQRWPAIQASASPARRSAPDRTIEPSRSESGGTGPTVDAPVVDPPRAAPARTRARHHRACRTTCPRAERDARGCCPD
jgi:hypothetical protein